MSGAVGALALAHSLGGDRAPIVEALSSLSRLIWRLRCPPAPPEAVEEPVAPSVAPPPAEEAPEEAVDTSSAWDPDGPEERLDDGRCRALLLEIIRRAAHDWVLYRTSQRLHLRQVAEEAYTWLFEEDEGHPRWRDRQKDGYTITAFVTICELLDLDPDYVRRRVKEMTPKSIMTAGRPAEKRRRQTTEEAPSYTEYGVSSSVSLETLDSEQGYSSSYEAHYSVSTPDYV